MIITISSVKRWFELKKREHDELLELRVRCPNCHYKSNILRFMKPVSGFVAWLSRNQEDKVELNNAYYLIRCPKCGSELISIDKKDMPKYVAVMV